MAEAMKAMLDQLMGKDRDLDPSERRERKWDDDDICPYFLVNFCPHDLFGNTKSDLGPCSKDHDEKLIEEFRKEPEKIQVRTEKRYLRHLQDLIRVVDNRVKRGEERLNLVSETPNAGPYAAELNKKNEAIRELQSEMETLGEEGKIDEVNELMEKLEALKTEKEAVELKNKHSGFSNEAASAMKMCEICGIWKSENPEDARAKNHFVGKQHVGYGKIRDTIKEIEEKHVEFDKKPPAPEEDKNEDRDKDRRRDRDRPDRRQRSKSPGKRSDRDGRDRERERRGGGDRDRRGGDRDRGRDRDRDRDSRRRR